MSDMTRCNWCRLREIRARAKLAGNRVTVLSDACWGMGGRNVYVHPRGVDVRGMAGGEDGPRKAYRAAWLMEVGRRCEC